MSEIFEGLRPGPGTEEEQVRDHRDVPRFVVGCDDDEQDMDELESGMKSEMFREEEMEDDDESVSYWGSFRCKHTESKFTGNVILYL